MDAPHQIPAFGTTLEKTYEWLNALSVELGTENQRSYEILRAFLHTLRDRLPVETVAKLAAQLPMLVRGFYYEGWDPTWKPEKMHAREFLDHFAREALLPPDEAERVLRITSHSFQQHVTEGELTKTLGILPNDIFQLVV